MTHPLVLGLFDDETAAAQAARVLRDLGHPRERVSIVARTHDEEGAIATAAGASPGAEIEDSRPAGRLGELSAHLVAAVAVVLPGIGPIVADGPLAAGLGEAAGHLAGDIGRMLARAGMPRDEAESWETKIKAGAVLLGAHTDRERVTRVAEALERHGARHVAIGTWSEINE
ncbi:MAG: hypothetical protein ACRD26_14875 [Vicinamibacterales bacterium]